MTVQRMNEPDRVEAFSDGVMAVVITLMAFNIKPPTGPNAADLGGSIPHVLVYVLSFAFIGIYWNNHHHLFRATGRISAGVMWANLLLLFWLSLLPVLTAWVAVFPNNALPAACYGVIGFAAAVSYYILVRTIIHANGSDSRIAVAIGTDVKGKVSLLLYAVAVGLAFLSPYAAYAAYVAVAVLWLVPDRRLTREHSAD